jgi:hypothetical protein
MLQYQSVQVLLDLVSLSHAILLFEGLLVESVELERVPYIRHYQCFAFI